MRVLLSLRHSGYLRLLESTVTELHARGHEVRLAFSRPKRHPLEHESPAMWDRLVGLERVSVCVAQPPGGTSRQASATGWLLAWKDYLRYFDEPFTDSVKLRERAARHAPAGMEHSSRALATEPRLRAAIRSALDLSERVIATPSGPLVELLDRERPDLVVVMPLLGRKSLQVDLVRAARIRGIPVAYCCASWDNLTTGGLLHAEPDRAMVWNEAQRDEAVALHDLDPANVVITGAPVFDVWFEARPTRDRETWCRERGLDPDRPYVLYAGSSSFIAPNELAYVRSWVTEKEGEPRLRGCQVLVRPHPQNSWEHAGMSDGPNGSVPGLTDVVVYPREGAVPLDDTSRADYIDSIHHSAAVVGVNTSAMIESAIMGRGVHVHLAERYRETQMGTPHFRHLLREGGGLVRATESIAAHLAGLADAIEGRDGEQTAERCRRFLERFVRPVGLTQPATPLLVRALEDLQRSGPALRQDPLGLRRAGERFARVVDELASTPAGLGEAPEAVPAPPTNLRVTTVQDGLAFFDGAATYTPYVGVQTEFGCYLVSTADRTVARSLVAKRGRGEMGLLGRALEALDSVPEFAGRNGRWFVDIGANIGTTTVTALLRHRFDFALACEPAPANARLLAVNAALNGLQGLVHIETCALSDDEGAAQLLLDEGNWGGHRIQAHAGDESYVSSPGGTITVACRTLDRLLAERHIEPSAIRLLWMDAQGHEGHILAGATKVVAAGVPIVTELYPDMLTHSGGMKLLRSVARDAALRALDLRDPTGGFEDLAAVVDRLPSGRFTDVLLLPASIPPEPSGWP